MVNVKAIIMYLCEQRNHHYDLIKPMASVYDIKTDNDISLMKKRIGKDYGSVVINCNGNYIPSSTFKSLTAQSLTLHQPILDEEVLSVISCNSVSIYCAKCYPSYPSYKSLRCKKFLLSYTADVEYSHHAFWCNRC